MDEHDVTEEWRVLIVDSSSHNSKEATFDRRGRVLLKVFIKEAEMCPYTHCTKQLVRRTVSQRAEKYMF